MTDPRRAAVVAEAATWLRTPYHHMGRVKNAGTDCLMLLAEVYEAAGVIPPRYRSTHRIGTCTAGSSVTSRA